MRLSELAVCRGRREATVGRPRHVGSDSGCGKRGPWERAARPAVLDKVGFSVQKVRGPLLGSGPGAHGDGQEGGRTPSRSFRRHGPGRVAAGGLEEAAPTVERTAA